MRTLRTLNKANAMTKIETKYYAFFDVDGTLLKGKPMLEFLKFFYQKQNSKFPFLGAVRHSLYRARSVLLGLVSDSREAQNRLYYTCFKGQSKIDIENLGKEWFSKAITDESYLLNVVDELSHHKSKKGVIVLVSGSFSACLHKIAEALGVDYTLAAELEEKNGQYTGRLVSEPVIGSGKHNAILRFISNRGIVDLNKCFAYGDHISDVPMLSLVGNPIVVSGDKNLEEIALKNSWKVINPV